MVYTQFKEFPHYLKNKIVINSFLTNVYVFVFFGSGIICGSLALNLVLLGDPSGTSTFLRPLVTISKKDLSHQLKPSTFLCKFLTCITFV